MPRRVASALVLGLLAFSSLPLRPEPPSRERELEAIRAEIAQLEQRLAQARREQSGLKGELAKTDLELQLQQERIAEATAARRLAAEQAAHGEQQVAALSASLAEARLGLGRRLAGLYSLGRQGYLRLFLSLKPDSTLLPSIRLMRFLARRDREAIDRYGSARDRLAAERDRLETRRAEIERWIGQEEARQRDLVHLRGKEAELLARAQHESQTLEARAGELADREKKLAAFLDLLYGKSPEALAGQPLQEFRGVLDWPVHGKVTAGFGPLLDPRYHTRVPHNGLDIQTAPGAEVRAVFPGKVLFAAPFEGYGTTVVLQHAGRGLTLYAGLSSCQVSREDVVSLGQVVGLASDRLYFEIRVENRPENPQNWLR
ncbi:MAG TPA: peptidoglycan DD-metalloendopeptidase family protein [Thermoanaerobaculia bacterium]|nr:peptidoglycan DD-metalloendopeptidase family protein [Thermoanaerobaculia bacterium]